MSNIFNSVSAKIPKRHKFNLSHQVKLTGEMGQLLPIMMEPVLPGDRFKLSSQQLIRFAPMVAPIMSDIDCYMHFFFVPNRIIWSKWEEFITASRKGKRLDDDDVPVPPRIGFGTNSSSYPDDVNPLDEKKYFGTSSLADYLGFQTQKEFTRVPAGASFFDELPFRAYQRIYFDWYRDENLSSFDDFEVIDDDSYNDGDNDVSQNLNRSNLLLKLQRRAWKKDYFTSALPFAQKGDDVLIPGSSGALGATISRLNPNQSDFATGPYFVNTPIAGTNPRAYVNSSGGGSLQQPQPISMRINPSEDLTERMQSQVMLNLDNLTVGGGSVSDGTIRELRRAMAAQRFLEREAVGGTRYIEQILAFFGVKSSDARMQRAEFLGGSKQPVVVSQVLQTSQSTTGQDASPLGQPAGNAVSAGGKYIFDREFEEHGWIVGIMSVIPRAEYMSGIPKKYLKRDRFDYYWPQFARIGEQSIQRQELQFDWQEGTDNDNGVNQQTFGYTPRYAEYRFINSHVHGDFKDTLDFWTLGRQYGDNAPLLNESFIECNPSNRIWSYENVDFSHLWIQVGLQISALRPLPKYGESI